MSLRDTLDRVPYWRAIAIASLGALALLWLQSTITASITEDNLRDSERFATHREVDAVNDRLIRIEEKVDLLLRR